MSASSTRVPFQGPLVSVIVPAYNHENTVVRALESVLNQTYPRVELVVIDDGSRDTTLSRVRSFREQVRGCFAIYSKPNGGVSSALNFGIAQSTGEFIALLASDDYYAVDKIQRQVELITQLGARVALVHSAGYDVDTSGKIVSNSGRYRPAEGSCLAGILALESRIVAPSVMFRRAAYDAIGGFDETMVAEDVDFHAAIAAAGYEFAYDPTPLVFKTVGESNLGAQIHRWFDVHHRTLRKYQDRFSQNEVTRISVSIYRHLGATAAGAGNLELSLKAFWKAGREAKSCVPMVQFLALAGRHAILSSLPSSARHYLRRVRAVFSRRSLTHAQRNDSRMPSRL